MADVAESFVRAVDGEVYGSVVDGVLGLLERPPGRKPPENLVHLSVWFRSMAEAEQQNVRRLVQLVAHQSVFGMLAALDGSRTLGSEVGVIVDGHDLTGRPLHELFQGMHA
jgi:hypothetical protein